jgi:hypothetical protein
MWWSQWVDATLSSNPPGIENKSQNRLLRVRPAGTLPWLGFDRVQPNRWFSRASIVESMHWMVLHRPVELAALTRQVALLCDRKAINRNANRDA